jgi:hypothetical protein
VICGKETTREELGSGQAGPLEWYHYLTNKHPFKEESKGTPEHLHGGAMMNFHKACSSLTPEIKCWADKLFAVRYVQAIESKSIRFSTIVRRNY